MTLRSLANYMRSVLSSRLALTCVLVLVLVLVFLEVQPILRV